MTSTTSAIRVALISDLHGNELALRAVLDDIARAGADRIVCLGDVATLGPQPRAVVQILRDLHCPCILGNHDAFLLDPPLIHSYTQMPILTEAVGWCRAELSADEIDFFRTFTPTLHMELDDGLVLFLFHGSPRSHTEDLLATTSPADLDRALAGDGAQVMAGGHTHIQMLRQHRGALLVNPGSVGMPFREYVGGATPTLLPHAEYAIVTASGGDIDVTLRRVALDREALRVHVAASANPLAPMLAAQYA